MSVNAGYWLRVSSRTQDELNQQPDIERWGKEHGYDHVATYQIHGASARKGNKKFDAAWQAVLDDFRSGKIDVLVVWYLSRLDRKLNATRMIGDVVKLGGRVEFVKQPHLNDLSTMGGRISLKVEEEIAFAESEEKSARILAKQNTLRAKGSLAAGSAPFGYMIELQENGLKILKPTAIGREWVPLIFRECAAGKSAAYICKMLTDAGVKTSTGKTVWHESSLAHFILKNPTYMGMRPNSGAMEVEALVTAEEYQAAGEALKGRKRNTRGASKHERVMLIPMCGADGCAEKRQGDKTGFSPMYRIFSGPEGYKTAYYRCTGKGPQRKGCGAKLIKVTHLEETLDNAMSGDTRPYREPVFIPGDDNAERLAALNERIAIAARQGDYALIGELTAQAKVIESQPHRKSRTEMRDTGLTIAKKWESLKTRDERREFLVTAQVQVIAWTGDNGNLWLLVNPGPGF